MFRPPAEDLRIPSGTLATALSSFHADVCLDRVYLGHAKELSQSERHDLHYRREWRRPKVCVKPHPRCVRHRITFHATYTHTTLMFERARMSYLTNVSHLPPSVKSVPGTYSEQNATSPFMRLGAHVRIPEGICAYEKKNLFWRGRGKTKKNATVYTRPGRPMCARTGKVESHTYRLLQPALVRLVHFSQPFTCRPTNNTGRCVRSNDYSKQDRPDLRACLEQRQRRPRWRSEGHVVHCAIGLSITRSIW